MNNKNAITMLESIKNDLINYEDWTFTYEQKQIDFIDYLLKNCIIIDKNKLLGMVNRQKILGISADGELTNTYRYSLDIERTITIGKYIAPTNEEDLVLKELDEKAHREFIKFFEEYLGVSENDK